MRSKLNRGASSYQFNTFGSRAASSCVCLMMSYVRPNEGLFINGNKMASETIWEIAIFFKNYLGKFPRISYVKFEYLM